MNSPNQDPSSPMAGPGPAESSAIVNPGRRKPGRKPGFVGSSNRDIDYSCSDCGGRSTREDLMAKRVSFTTIGSTPKTVRSRTVKWLCEVCMMRDPDFNLDPRTSAPGNADLIRKNGGVDAEAVTE